MVCDKANKKLAVIDETFMRCYCGRCYEHENAPEVDSEISSEESSKKCCIAKKKKRKIRKKISSGTKSLENCLGLQHVNSWCSSCIPKRGPKVPITRLCPGINKLSVPRVVGKPPIPEPLLPKRCIKNWKAHREWLCEVAKPKAYYDLDDVELMCVDRGPKLKTLKRIHKLAKPRFTWDQCCTPSVSCGDVKESAMNYVPSERILELSEPKFYPIGQVYLEHVPFQCLTMVSPYALKYKATKRIEKLAVPRRHCPWDRAPQLYKCSSCPSGKKCGTMNCSHLNQLSTPKLSCIAQKDYRHVSQLDTYKFGSYCQLTGRMA